MTRWSDIDPRLRELAERVLTEKELEAFKLSIGGAGYRRVAFALCIAPETARNRIRNAKAKLIRAVESDHDDQEPAA